MEAREMAAVRVDAHPSPFNFTLGQKKKQSLVLVNPSPRITLSFKIQCTESARFRLQPSRGVLGPQQSAIVHIQLASHNTTEGQCVFLVLSTRADVESAAGDPWNHDSASVSKEFVSSRILRVDDAAATKSLDAPTLQPPPLVECDAALVIRLLAKNMSRKASNQLDPSDVDLLRRTKDRVSSSTWRDWTSQACALRRAMQERKHALRRTPPMDASGALLSPPPSPHCKSEIASSVSDGERFTACSSSGTSSSSPACSDDACMWTRYMLDVCTQHLEQTTDAYEDLLRHPEKARAKLAALRRSAQTLLKLRETNPFLATPSAQRLDRCDDDGAFDVG
ncbi:Aste57867_8770 [Aphanomyces stellatus]|uniref:Aste57867_8770 protein n=1 Tax=Aphanomyces stellatus TaxID=120398 RepID=A0A485KLI9_9STRA|nr:hypothetical protein As57867_008736 [Aphanomyces stellatus]VFT85656.1 Aste57867_8770 [Aphanomyces stellatus]